MTKPKAVSSWKCWVCLRHRRQGGWAMCKHCEEAYLHANIAAVPRDLDIAMWAVTRVRELNGLRT